MRCVLISSPEPHKILNRFRIQISKKCRTNKKLKILLCLTKLREQNLERSSTLRVSRAEIWLTVYRSIYIIRMQEDFNSYWACAYLCTCLPCDPAGNINSLYNEKVYHSKSKSICINEMCVSIKLGAP